MSNLFEKATKNAAINQKKVKEEKIRIRYDDNDFFDKLESLERLQENMKKEKAVVDILSDEVKQIAIKQWSSVFETMSQNPGSVVIESRRDDDIAQMMFVPSDRYINIDETRASYLQDTYGEDAVEEKIAFAIDNEMVDKYGEILSQLIQECDDIDQDDKGRIVKAVRSYSVKKGAIDKFKEFADENNKEVSDMFEEFKPVTSVKNVEIIKS
jgi:hypothetical protein